MNRIVYKNYEFNDDTILEGKIHLESSLSADELSADTFDFNVIETAGSSNPLQSSEGDYLLSSEDEYLFAINYEMYEPLHKFKYGDLVQYYRDDDLIGNYYLTNIQRINKRIYRFECSSSIGILANITHYGGIYNNRRFEDCVAEILGSFAFVIKDESMKNELINGWLPIASARDNLQQLLFVVGANLYKAKDGTLVISYNNTTEATEIETDRFYMDGANLEYTAPATSIAILEHTYLPPTDSTEEKELYNSSGELNTQRRVVFDEPMGALRTDGTLIINESNANYAVISGTGNLYGKPFTHYTREQVEDLNIDSEPYEIRVEDATLVNTLNSSYVSKRVANYYSTSSIISYSFVANNDDYAGKLVKFYDPYGDFKTGFIKSMDITLSGKLKADAKIATDFIPGPFGNNYKNYLIIANTNQTVWRVPDSLRHKEVLITLIGGGSGGHSGQAGHHGHNTNGSNREDYDGLGGEAGKAGEVGKVLQFTTVLNQPSYLVQAGLGGESDQDGYSTYFTNTNTGEYFTSALGYITDIPFVNIFTGQRFAVRGEDGMAGGKGANSPENVTWKGITYNAGKKGTERVYDREDHEWTTVTGGYGGGAAVGQDGSDSEPSLEGDHKGGKGADATINGDDAVSFGSSGSGGHGGGGGGNAVGYDDEGFGTIGGVGGNPSLGGRGAQGCIVIYW